MVGLKKVAVHREIASAFKPTLDHLQVRNGVVNELLRYGIGVYGIGVKPALSTYWECRDGVREWQDRCESTWPEHDITS